MTLAAAGLPQIPRLAGEARSYAERLFRFPRIGALEGSAAQAALIVPAEREGALYEDEAVSRTLELTQGYRFYLQEFGKHIWNLAPTSPITRAVQSRVGCQRDGNHDHSAIDRASEAAGSWADLRNRGLRLRRFHGPALRRVHATSHAVPTPFGPNNEAARQEPLTRTLALADPARRASWVARTSAWGGHIPARPAA